MRDAIIASLSIAAVWSVVVGVMVDRYGPVVEGKFISFVRERFGIVPFEKLYFEMKPEHVRPHLRG